MKKKLLFTLILFFSFCVAASAAPIVQGYSADGLNWVGLYEGRTATASFAIVDEGDTLQITLVNTSADDTPWSPNEGLAGIFFGAECLADPDLTLTAPNVIADDGAYQDGILFANPGDSMNGEFAFTDQADDFSDYTYPQYLVTSSALDGDWGGETDPMGDKLIDPEGSLYSPDDTPDGKDFLILSTNTDPGNAFGDVPYVYSSVLIQFDISDWEGCDSLDCWDISDVYFAYGTDYAAPVPEPATMLLLGTGLLGLAVTGRKKFKK